MRPRPTALTAAVALTLASLPAAGQVLLPPPGSTAPSGYSQITFGDDFDGTTLDTVKWNIDPQRLQLSSGLWQRRNYAGNVAVGGGDLQMTNLWQDPTGDGPGYTNALVWSRTARQRFGYWEARMKMADYEGVDNAFWLYSAPGLQHANLDIFEIDAVEAFTTADNKWQVGVIDHDPEPNVVHSGTTNAGFDMAQAYTVVGMEWGTDNRVRFFRNGVQVFEVTPAQMNARRSMIPLSTILSTMQWTPSYVAAADGSQARVDWVRAYQKPGWIGGSGTSWATVANWGPDGVPGSGRAAMFNTSGVGGTITLPADQPVQEISLQTAAAGALTIAGPGRLLLGATSVSGDGVGGIMINTDADASLTVSAGIVAQRDLRFSNFSGTTNQGGTPGVALTLSGPISADAAAVTALRNNLEVLNMGEVTISGSIASSVRNVLKVGQGNLTLGASNAFTGTVTLRGGTILVTTDNALGSTAGPTVVEASSFPGTLLFGAVNYTAAEPLTIGGTGANNFGYTAYRGAIDVFGQNTSASFAGPVTLSNDADIGFGTTAQNATLSMSGDVAVGNFALTLDGGGQLHLTGRLSGSSSATVRAIASGTVTLTGNSTLYLGTFQLNAGVVAVNSATALGGASGNVLLMNGGTLRPTATFATAKSAVLGGAGTASTFDTPTGVTLTLTGTVTGTGGLTKTGSGMLVLNQSPSFTGPLRANVGTLQLNASLLTPASLTVGSTATVTLAGGNNVTLRVPALTFNASTSRLNLTDGRLLLDYGPAELSPLQSVRGWLAAGQLHSSHATANRRLGYGEASMLGLSSVAGVSVDATTLLVTLAFAGDTDLDGLVDIDDLRLVARNLGRPSGAFWTVGDFDYNGTVDSADLALMRPNYLTPLLGSFDNDLAALGPGWPTIPEPRSLAAIPAAAIPLLRRRRPPK